MLRILSLAAVIGAASACGPRAPGYDYTTEPDPRTSEYIIGVSDQLLINVWNNPALSGEALVRPDGTITMPLIGDLQAAGETPTSLKEKIRVKLSSFIKLEGSPVTVAVTAANSYRFTVSGEANSPGIFTANHYLTVAEAIALAGGFTRFAKRNEVVLMRQDPKSGQIRRIPIAYTFIADGSNPEMNIIILSGDSIYIP